jgi:hypothetical protein
MFRRELERWDDPTQRSLSLSPGARALAATIDAAAEAAEDVHEKAVAAMAPPAKKKGR